MSTSAEAIVIVFSLTSAMRLLAYAIQIVRLMGDRTGAASISSASWLLFSLSHLATFAYAVFVIADNRMAAAFGGNAALCLVILVMIIRLRRRA